MPAIMIGRIVAFDYSGVVTAVGPGVPDFKVGDAVFGSALGKGALAEHIVTKASMAAKKPVSLTFFEAASLTTVYITSLQSIRDHGKLPTNGAVNRSVLVLGASGGCGLAALQLSKALGVNEIVGEFFPTLLKNKCIYKNMNSISQVDCLFQHLQESAAARTRVSRRATGRRV